MKHTLLKKIGSTLLITGLAFVLPAYADKHGGKGAMDMGKKPAMVMTDSEKKMQMGKMQEAMLRMHEQMHKIKDAKNPQEREQLMQEHTKMMQEQMRMMHGMEGMGAMMDAGQDKQMDQMHKDMPAAPAKQ
jgi:hypothetical protein